MGVMAQFDVRAYPIELAKEMLKLAGNLNMQNGPTAYNEAEIKLHTIVDDLTTYYKVAWPTEFNGQDFFKYKASIVRFITLKQYSPMFKAAVARQLLDMMHYFPVSTPTPSSEIEYLDE